MSFLYLLIYLRISRLQVYYKQGKGLGDKDNEISLPVRDIEVNKILYDDIRVGPVTVRHWEYGLSETLLLTILAYIIRMVSRGRKIGTMVL